MSESRPPITLHLRGREHDEPRLPALFAGVASRAAEGAAADVFLPPGYLRPLASYDVGPAARGEAAAEPQQRAAAENEVVVLELADGGVLVTSAARLRESLQRAQPDLVDTDGRLHLERLRAGAVPAARDLAGIGEAAARLVSRVFTFAAGEARDGIVDKALEKFAEPALLGVSWAGTKALMWAIEERLDQPAGSLRRWAGGSEFGPANTDAGRPMLVFVHGTASSTRGSFGDLREGDPALWRRLERHFTGGIHGFEHRTLSESPIDNAIQLVQQLPAGARVSLVSHSRGGLVADLLCLDAAEGGLAKAIGAYRAEPGLLARRGEAGAAVDVDAELERAYAEQRERLADLAALVKARGIRVERYVRVASPARGTRLASGNIDVFLSGLLTLVGQVPFLKASPLYSAFKRVVIEIAKNRTRPQLVPGIEAMLPESPMARLLRAAPVRGGIEMAVIAGDIEGGGLLQRLGTFLTDTLVFDRGDNDLVVDTDAMFTGIAPRAAARALLDRGPDVTHFRYFTNPHTRDALADWLTLGPASAQTAFRALPALDDPALAFVPDTVRRGEPETRPIVVMLPGVMGTHLAVKEAGGELDRIWLDPFDIAKGGLKSLAWGQPGVEAQELFSLFYGALARELQRTHVVRRFPYDWRQPLDVLADAFAKFLEDEVLKEAGERPVRLLAHSMGGLVVRATIHRHRGVMDRVMLRDGARLVMCGTPHQGAHSMVENLIGKGDTLRTLVRLDLASDMQEVLDIVAGFRGALALLPRPGFRDTFQGEEGGGGTFDYQSPDTWAAFARKVKDFWFGDGKVGRPSRDVLRAASWLWEQDRKAFGDATPSLPAEYAPRSIYVFGVDKNTPCGVSEDAKGRVRMVGTTRGDGTVTWDSGRIGGIGSFYYLPAAHGDLLAKAAHFDALVELLADGRTARLDITPPAVRALEAEAVPVVYDAGAPVAADAVTLARMAVGASLASQVEPLGKRTLAVSVRAMDLRFVRGPILVGHYESDPISGPEALIDRELLDGKLHERHDLGLYAGPRGTAVAVLLAEDPSGRRPGAVVTGLGPYDGSLTQPLLTEAVRAGVLRYLLHVGDVIGRDAPVPPLTTLLLGYNSSAHLTVHASVEALVRGVVEANARFQEATRSQSGVTRLEIVELFRDTAITACYALRDMAPRLTEHAVRHACALQVETRLEVDGSARSRLFDSASASYWPRIVVAAEGPDDAAPAAAPEAGAPRRRRAAHRLRFLFLGQRARAEAVSHQRQPGLLEQLVRSQIHVQAWQPDVGRTLFQLAVPHEFKSVLGQSPRAVLVVDETTANLPWEMMLGESGGRDGIGAGADRDGESLPLALRMALVRQFQTPDYRRHVRASSGSGALVVGNPSVEGFVDAFAGADARQGLKPPPALPGAEAEARSVAERLARMGYEVDAAIGTDQMAADVLVQLCRRPRRLLHVSAHGVFEQMHVDGLPRTGVVLSGGFLITAAEIEALEVVPELVFLNCCHLGRIDERHEVPLKEANRLAASLARQLIDIGVRCVVVAGWAVTDSLAKRFGEVFYDRLLAAGQPFGVAVHEARRALWDENRDDITWGAFQAYGDPDWRAERAEGGRVRGDGPFASRDELLDALARQSIEAARRASSAGAGDDAQGDAIERLMSERCRPEWREQPVVQSALGRTWFALGDYERARHAFARALATAGPDDPVPMHDIEQLANAEARMGGKGAGQPALVDLAIERLRRLGDAVQATPAAGPGPAPPPGAPPQGAERHALLGSAWKIKATLLARRLAAASTFDAQDAAALTEAVAESARAYGAASLPPTDPGFDPYTPLNRLALEPLGGAMTPGRRAEALRLVRECAQAARAKAAHDTGPWSALMTVEADWVESMLDGRFAAAGGAGERELKRLQEAYAAQLGSLPVKPNELGSVTGQHTKLHLLWSALARVDAARRDEAIRVAERLLALARSIDPKSVELGGADARWWRQASAPAAAVGPRRREPTRTPPAARPRAKALPSATDKATGKATGKAAGKAPGKAAAKVTSAAPRGGRKGPGR